MQRLAEPPSEDFIATTGEGVELYGAVCPLPKRLQHLYSCPPVEPVQVQQPSNPRLHWMLIAHHAMRRRMSIARLGEQAAPTNLPTGGY